MVWVAVVVVVGLVVGGLFVLLGGDEAAAGEVILEPAGADGDDPFMDSVATSAVEVESGGVEEVAGGQDGVESINGATPGLYGGTGENACDAAALVAFLEDNSDKAEAFADVVGIDASEIGDYVAGLTPVLLREDTRVTNHGFADGRATSRQSVFQAGTAVMVDDRGVPRVRCACGNPLTEPEAGSGTYEGDPWAGFDDTRLVAVAPADEAQTQLELVDVTTGQRLTVPVGGGGGLTVEQLLNVSVPLWCGEEPFDEPLVPLVDGRYTCPNPPTRFPSPSGNYQIWVVGTNTDRGDTGPPKAAVGDLTGDGLAEGVLITHAFQGQAGYGPDQQMVFSSDGTYLLTGPNDLPGYAQDVRIVDGVIEFTGAEFGECTACPPGPPFTASYVLDGTQLVPAGASPSGSGASDDPEAAVRAYIEADGDRYLGLCPDVSREELEAGACAVPIADDETVWQVGDDPSGDSARYLLVEESDGGWAVADDYRAVFAGNPPDPYADAPDWVRPHLDR